METPKDNLEFAISQAVDGVLADADRRALGVRLTDADALQWSADHERLNSVLRAHRPLPSVDFESFAASFAERLSDEETYAPAPLKMWPVWRSRLAVAATVGLVALAAWPLLPHRDRSTPTGPSGEVVVVGPVIVTPTTAPTVTVVVGPSDAMVRRGLATGIGNEAPATPQKPKIVITSAEVPSDARPY